MTATSSREQRVTHHALNDTYDTYEMTATSSREQRVTHHEISEISANWLSTFLSPRSCHSWWVGGTCVNRPRCSALQCWWSWYEGRLSSAPDLGDKHNMGWGPVSGPFMCYQQSWGFIDIHIYLSCCCPGSLNRQGISRHGIDSLG